MCRLFGYSGNGYKDMTKALREFYFRGALGNPHGWGLAAWEAKDIRSGFIAKEPNVATDSKYLKYILKSKVKPRLVIGHVRFATKGNNALENTHPFMADINGVRWVLAHNGTLKGNIKRPKKFKPHGKTDSEKILCLIAEALDDGAGLIGIEATIESLSYRGKMNLLFTDGERLYVYHNQGSLKYYQEKGHVIISTTPVGNTSNWKDVEKGKLMIFENGEMTYKSNKLHAGVDKEIQYGFSWDRHVPSTIKGLSLAK